MELLILIALCIGTVFGVGQYWLLTLDGPNRLFALIPAMLAAVGAVVFALGMPVSGWGRLGWELMMLSIEAPAVVGLLGGGLVWGLVRLVAWLRK